MKQYSNWAGTMPPDDKHPHFGSLFQAASDENTAASGEENRVYRIGTNKGLEERPQRKDSRILGDIYGKLV